MAIASLPVNVPADAWEAIKSTFMSIANLSDDASVSEVCENAILEMERLQQVCSVADEPDEQQTSCPHCGAFVVMSDDRACVHCGGTVYGNF